MHYASFVSLFLLIAPFAYGQNSFSKDRSMEDEEPVKEYHDFIIIELHNDLFLETVQGMDIRPWSPGINVSVMPEIVLGESVFSLASGIAFSSFNVHLNGNFERDTLTSSGFVRFQPFDDRYSWNKHKVSANYLEVPVEFRIRAGKRKPFKLTLGAKAGYLVNVHTKTIDEDGKRKFYDVPEINRWRYGVYGRIGFRRLSVYGFYSLSTFLNEGTGVELTPVTLGLSLAMF